MARPRFEVHEYKDRIYIDDDDFGWDACLRIGGDFDTKEQKIAFAEAICVALNDNAHCIPTRDSYAGNGSGK